MARRDPIRRLQTYWGAFAAALLAGAVMAGAACASSPMPVDAKERATMIEALATKLSTTYIDAPMAARMAAQLRRNSSRGDYDALTDGQVLADRLTADLRMLARDKHLWIGFRPEGARDEPVDGPSPAELDKWAAVISRDNFGFDRVERLAGNIGYLKFRIFAYPYLATDTAVAAMNFVGHTDALIIDLRENTGGDPEMVAFLASYLFDVPTRLNDIRRRDGEVRQYWSRPTVPGTRFGSAKPVYVLTSAGTFSAAEDFAYALQTRKRATVVGETSGGGAHPSREFKIGERFSASVPDAESLSPLTHKNWEQVGIIPDIAVPASAALEAARRAALTRLIDESADPGRRAEWRSLLK